MGLSKDFALPVTPSKKRARRATRTGDGSHHVYFMSLCSGSLVKIGYTKDIRMRMVNLASELGMRWDEIYLLGSVSVPMGQGPSLAKALHSRLSVYRQIGEWFDVQAVNLLDVAIDVARSTIVGNWAVSGLASDDVPDFGEKWNIGRVRASQMIKRRKKWR